MTASKKVSKATSIIAMTALACVLALACGCSQQPSGGSQSQGSATASAQSKAARQEVKVLETGFSADDHGMVHYGVIIENPNEGEALNSFEVNLTAKGADGQVLGTDTAHPTYLFPHQKTAVCGLINAGQAPASIEATVTASDSAWTDAKGLQGGEVDEFLKAENVSEVDKGYGMVSVTGEIANSSDSKAGQTIVNVVVRDAAGSIVYGNYTYVNGEIPAHGKTAFSLDCFNLPSHAKVEAYPMMYAAAKS